MEFTHNLQIAHRELDSLLNHQKRKQCQQDYGRHNWFVEGLVIEGLSGFRGRSNR